MKLIDEAVVEALLKVQVSPIFFGWVSQFPGQMEITWPKSVVEEYKKHISKLNQICRESLFGAKQKNCLYFRDADAPPIVVPSYSVETYFAVSEEQAEKEHIKRCIHPELPNNHYVYSEMHSLPDSLYESKDCYEGETIWKIPKDRIEEIARLLRLDKSDYPYMSALEMIDGDFFWIIAWDD